MAADQSSSEDRHQVNKLQLASKIFIAAGMVLVVFGLHLGKWWLSIPSALVAAVGWVLQGEVDRRSLLRQLEETAISPSVTAQRRLLGERYDKFIDVCTSLRSACEECHRDIDTLAVREDICTGLFNDAAAVFRAMSPTHLQVPGHLWWSTFEIILERTEQHYFAVSLGVEQWDDPSQKRKAYWVANRNAIKRGVVIERIFVLYDREDRKDRPESGLYPDEERAIAIHATAHESRDEECRSKIFVGVVPAVRLKDESPLDLCDFAVADNQIVGVSSLQEGQFVASEPNDIYFGLDKELAKRRVIAEALRHSAVEVEVEENRAKLTDRAFQPPPGAPF